MKSRLLTLTLLAACTHAGNGAPEAAVAPQPVSEPARASGALTVTQLLAQKPSGELRVAGNFMAFQGPCGGAPPSRSAWHLVDLAGETAACIYVAGPLAEGTRTMPAEGVGVQVTVHGTLQEQDGVPFIEAREVSR